VLREGHAPAKKDQSELSNSARNTNHRKTEKERRATIRGLLDQISAFFLVEGQKKISIGDLLLLGKLINSRSNQWFTYQTVLVIIYLEIGEWTFPERVRPRPRDHGQLE